MTTDYCIDGLHCRDHQFQVPLDYQQPEGEQLNLFAREVATRAGMQQSLPYLVFFQGGPGFAAGRPSGVTGWIKAATAHYRVLLLDQRGTGCSSPLSVQTLSAMSPGAEQAAYLSHFRADNIIRDAEHIRQALIGEGKWSILGQSFGGFCVLRYLSAAPQGLARAFITGGIPSLTKPATEVYQATFPRVNAKNKAFFERFPKAQGICQAIAEHLANHEEMLANGERLTVEHFQLLGIHLGLTGGQETLYYLLEQAFVTVGGETQLNVMFKHQLMQLLDYESNLLFSMMHESIYCQGRGSHWAAHQVRQTLPAFNYQPGDDFLFTGEMVFPWMYEQFANLKPLKETAEMIAAKTDWPALYDLPQLAANSVPVAAAIYVDDMFVDFNYSLESVAEIRGIKTFISNEYEHNGIRIDGETIFNKLYALLD